jgi:adenylate cyclase
MSTELLKSVLRPIVGNRRKAERRLSTIIGVDISGYSILMAQDEMRTHARVGAAMSRVLRLIETGRGHVFSFSGDGVMAEFPTASAALNCALRLQMDASRRNRRAPTRREILYRVGINSGEIVVLDGQVGGHAVNIAARLEQMAVPGKIFLSQAVFEQVRTEILACYECLGQVRVKNIRDPVTIYNVDVGEVVRKRSRRKPSISNGLIDRGTRLHSPGYPGCDVSHQFLRRTDADHEQAINRLPVMSQIKGQERAYREPAPAHERLPGLAVLPFGEAGDATVPRHLRDGLTCDIICQLAGLRDLRVISHGSTVRFRQRDTDPRSIGATLNARYILRGMVRGRRNALRLSLELAESENGFVIWTRTRDFDHRPSFKDQDDIVAELVNTLAPRVRDAELLRIRGQRTENMTAYELILLARQKLLTLDPAGFAEAKVLIEEAIDSDPSYAEAFALAADWHGLQISQGMSTDREYDHIKADRLGREALARDPNNVRALTRFGHRKALLQRDFDVALKVFDRTLSIAPHAAHAWMWSSHTFAYMGDASEAVRRAKYAINLSPCDVEAHYFLGALCMAHYAAGEYEAAADAGLRALAEPRPSRSFRQFTVAALTAIDRREAAQPIVARIIMDQPGYNVRQALSNLPHKNLVVRSRYAQQLVDAGLPP